MAKNVPAAVIDPSLDKTATATQLLACAGQPSDRADALTKALMTISVSSGDFTKANGDVSGRKVTVAQKSGVFSASGTADHICLIDGTTLLDVTTCAATGVTSGGNGTINSWKREIQQAT